MGYQAIRAKSSHCANQRKGSQSRRQPRQVQTPTAEARNILGEPLNESKKANENTYGNDPDALLIMQRRLEGNAKDHKKILDRKEKCGLANFQNEMLKQVNKSAFHFEIIDKQQDFVDK